MPRLLRLGVPTLLVVVLTACSQVEPVLFAVSMPDCARQGPAAMREGRARLILTLNGLGDVGLELVELTGDREYEDLTEHIDVSPEWDSPPPWVRQVATLRIEDGIGIDSVEETLQLEEGLYALVCIEQPYGKEGPVALPAGSLRVRAG